MLHGKDQDIRKTLGSRRCSKSQLYHSRLHKEKIADTLMNPRPIVLLPHNPAMGDPKRNVNTVVWKDGTIFCRITSTTATITTNAHMTETTEAFSGPDLFRPTYVWPLNKILFLKCGLVMQKLRFVSLFKSGYHQHLSTSIQQNE